jgi:methylthioribose-1-phosphate isomerase
MAGPVRMANEARESLRDAIEKLKAQRPSAAAGTSVLERIITCCSEVARLAERASVRRTALDIRNEAITRYAERAEQTSAQVLDLLEEAIARLQDELGPHDR